MSAGWAAEDVSSSFLVRNWRNEEGMPHSIINSIIQTRDGYLWIGTYVGLVRFDGVRFTQFSSSNVPEMEDGRIAYVFEDREGTLWISLESGRLLAWKEGKVRVHVPGGPGHHPVIAMVQWREGTIWLQTADGQLGRINDAGIEFMARTGSLGRQSLALAVDSQDELWIGTSRGPQFWRDGNLVPTGLSEISGSAADAMAPARDGGVWIFRRGRLWKAKEGAIVEEIAAPSGLAGVAGMLEATDGRFWLGAGDGRLFCRKNPGGWEEVSDVGFQGLNRILFEDREGNLWRGGFGGGLTRIRPRVFTVHDLPDASLDRYARTVCADSRGNVWSVLNGQRLVQIPAGKQAPEPVQSSATPQNIKALFVDRRDSLWVGTSGGYLFRRHKDSFVQELRIADRIEAIYALFEDSEENLWLGYTGGAGVGFLPKGKDFQALEDMPYPDVRAIAQDAEGAMWFGTHYGGAFRLKDKQWMRLTLREGLPSDYVRCLLADPDGTVWLGTLHGLCRWRDGKLITITAEQGLWNDSISHIADDGRGNLWLSSFGGVFRIEREELDAFCEGRSRAVQCVGYDRDDGLASVECSGGFQPAGVRTPDGRLWFPTVNGLVSVLPGGIQENTLPPSVWIENATIDNVPVAIHPSTRTIEVEPGGRRIDFRFTALSFSSPEKVRFRHKLSGLDSEWSVPDDLRTVAYSYIPPGCYTLEVMASNNDGVWSSDGQKLAIIIQPFYWQTWWFKALVGLVLATALAWSVRRIERWKARLRLQRLEQKHAVERERSRIARDIHDDLGANLTQIVFLSQRVETASDNRSEVERWIRMIPATASRTIQSLDEIVWAINPRHDSLESLANYLSRFAQEFLALAGIRCVLDVPTVLPPVPLSAEVRHNLVLSAREALQNIATHAKASEARVQLQLDEHRLSVVISDNGAGFRVDSAVENGNGLANMRKRLGDIGGRVEIISEPGRGTTVRFEISRSHLLGRMAEGES